jgi:hypothetical protein
MKKVLLVLLLLALVAGAFLFWKKQEASPSALELVPASTVAFLEVPDIARSRERWKNTALFKILHEPTVQAFLERPRSKVPKSNEVHSQVDRVRRIDPREAFAAFTSLSGSQFLAGFRFGGKKEDVDSLSTEIKAQIHKNWPAAKTDLVSHPAGSIETFSVNNFTVAIVTTKNWWFVSDKLELLQSALDRVSGKVHGKAGTLAESDLFKKSAVKLPGDPELFFFTQTQEWMDRLITLMKTTGQEMDAATLAKIRSLQAIAGSTRFEGELVRDTFFSVRTGATEEPQMARNSMTLTNVESLAYYAAVLNFDQNFHLPNPALDQSGILKRLEDLRQALAKSGVTMDDVVSSLGKELGAVMDWPQNSPQPSLLVSLDIRDRARAQKIVDVLTTGQAGLPVWAKQQDGGNTFYVLSSLNIGFLTPALALSDKFIVLGLTLPSVQQGLKRLAGTEPKLDSVPSFQKITKSLTAPSKSFAYLDAKGVFEKVYGIARPLIMMYGSFAPGFSVYVDVNKLPAVETISQHLGSIAASQSTGPDGDFSESVGTVTFTQAAVLAGIGAGVAIPAAMKNHLIPTPPNLAPAPPAPLASPAISPAASPVPSETSSPAPAMTP